VAVSVLLDMTVASTSGRRASPDCARRPGSYG
jgi:hypothetical protein